ncbi:MAG TPA: hypothetical protein PKE27_07930 [Povalibacter sp.]|uniref:hypothetical protein n=1 Tax=Povalibacter sp. TaxID=1962978 RepID=UPI002B824A66|nr:hypothetical protein [Povalibacter sp.]HMN44484.1 hypothetical protein [Povalibacter sp.]
MTTKSGSSNRLSRLCALLLTFSFCVDAFAAETSADAPAPHVQAIWKTQELSFYFQSFTTFYACRSLEDRVRMLLIELGADKDVKVRATSCFGNEIARLPHVRINVTAPIEATPEALAELEKTRSTRELAARVRGERMTESTEQFPAYWKPVSLSRGSFRLEPGDCELVEQLKRSVLPKLSIRIVKDNMSCMPNQNSIGQPRLEVEALTVVPPPDARLPVVGKPAS